MRCVIRGIRKGFMQRSRIRFVWGQPRMCCPLAVVFSMVRGFNDLMGHYIYIYIHISIVCVCSMSVYTYICIYICTCVYRFVFNLLIFCDGNKYTSALRTTTVSHQILHMLPATPKNLQLNAANTTRNRNFLNRKHGYRTVWETFHLIRLRTHNLAWIVRV